MNHTIIAALAVLIASAPTAQAATSTASLNLDHLNISAFDLDLNDNFVGNFQILGTSALAGATIDQSGQPHQQQLAQGYFPTLSLASSANPNSSGSVSIDANGLQIAVSATGDFHQISASGTNSYWNPQENASPPGYNIRLAPRTGLLVSGDYQVALSSDCSYNIGCAASVLLEAYIQNGAFGQSTAFNNNFWASKDVQSFTGTAGTSYLNLSDEYADITVVFKGTASILSVPEPTSVGLMVAGAFTVAAARRRTRKA